MGNFNTNVGSSVPERRPRITPRTATTASAAPKAAPCAPKATAPAAKYTVQVGSKIKKAVNPFIAWGAFIAALAISGVIAYLAWF